MTFRAVALFGGLFGVLSPSEMPAQSCFPLPPGAVAWWRAEGNALDSIGTNHGASFGTSFAPGRVGQAYSFDGIDDSIHPPAETFAMVTNDFTMEVWVNPSTNRGSTAETINANNGLNTGQRYAIFPAHGLTTFGSGHVGAGISVGTNGVSVFEHTDGYLPSVLVHNAPIQGWTHLAVVYADRQPSLYVNGVFARTGLRGPSIVHPSMDLGGLGGPYGLYPGLLDEYTIYNRALSAAEIQGIFNAQSAGKCLSNQVSILPANTTVVAGGTQTFTASGGSAPYSFSLAANNSGGSIDPASGLYTAGSTVNVTDTVRVTDALGVAANTTVNVIPQPSASFRVQTFDEASPLPLAGAAIAVTGSATGNGVTDGAGQVTFSFPAAGTYTFTPSKAHYTFAPTSLSLTAPTTPPVSLFFTGRVDRFTVSGAVTNPAGMPLSGVSVSLNPGVSGAANSANSLNGPAGLQTFTDASGQYTFSNVRAGDDYLVVPSQQGFIFTPSSSLITALAAPQTRNFRGIETNRTIHVRVARADSSGLAGVNVVLSRDASRASLKEAKTTDANGIASFTNLAPEKGHVVIPSHATFTFSPRSQTVSLIDSDQTVNFIAQQSFNISGRINGGSGVAVSAVNGLTVFFDDAATGANVASVALLTGDANAAFYASPQLPGGRSYVVRANAPGFEFTPATRTVPNLTANVTGIDFTIAQARPRISGQVTNSAGFGLSAPRVGYVYSDIGGPGGGGGGGPVDDDGRYSFENLNEGHYTVTASKTNFLFNPPSALLGNLTTSRTQNFLGTPPFPLTGRIAFARNGEPMAMNADSSGLVRIPIVFPGSRIVTERGPALSPDGTKVAYVPVEGNAVFPLVVQNVDGSDVRLLTASGENTTSPAWSPDGRLVAVTITASGIRLPGIYLINISDGSAFRLPNSTGLERAGLSWSPDGTKIAFAERSDNNLFRHEKLYVTDTNGVSDPLLLFEGNWHPAWSPDGTQIACGIRSFNPPDPQNSLSAGFESKEIGIRNFPEDNGLPARRLTFLPVLNFDTGVITPTWSPDGSLLAFSADKYSLRIFVMNADGTSVTPLVRGNYTSWSRAPGLRTPPGSNVTVSNGIAAVTFSTVTTLGTTTVIPTPPPQTETMPPGYVSISGGSTLMNFEITTTASNSGPIILCFTLTNITNSATFDALRILHNENGVLVDRTILPPDLMAPNFEAKTICARVDFLSPFSIAQMVNPARAMIVGMVVDAVGNPLGDIGLTLNDSGSVSVRTDLSGSFILPNLTPNTDHIVVPSDARFDFDPPVGVVASATGTNTLAFIATPKAAPLTIAPDAVNPGRFALTWPVTLDEYVLESTDSLAAPNWTPAADPFFLVGDQYLLSLQPGSSTRFFRLRKVELAQ